MSAPMTPVLSSLSAEQRTTVEAVETPVGSRGTRTGRSVPVGSSGQPVANETPVTFPRADGQNALPGCYRFYATDCRRLMRRWVLQHLDDAPGTQLFAAIAAQEIGRDVNAHEAQLIGEVFADILVARVALQRITDTERARAREIL